MKRLILLLMLCGYVPYMAFADNNDGYRELTNKNGKTIRAKILSYDKSTDSVLIERDNHQQYNAKAEAFCKQDQNIIRNWDLLGDLMSNSSLSISIKRVTGKKEGNTESKTTENGEDMTRWYTASRYTIYLDNRTIHALDDIRVEAVPYMKYDVIYKEKKINFSIKRGPELQKFDIDTIDPGGHKEVSTQERVFECVLIEKGRKTVLKQVMEVIGVWVRVYVTLPNGSEVIVRDIQEPDELWTNVAWSDAYKAFDVNTHEFVDEASLLARRK